MLILDTAAKRVNKNTGRSIRKTAQNKEAQRIFKRSLLDCLNGLMRD